MVLADVQFRELEVSNGVEWERQAVQFYFESVDMEGGGTGRRFDRRRFRCSRPGISCCKTGAHELFTPRKLRCPASFIRQRWMDKSKLLESVPMDCGRAEWTAGCVRCRLVVFGVDWRRMEPMDGWRRMASMDGWRRKASTGVDWRLAWNGVGGSMASNGFEWHKRALTWKSLWCPWW